MIVFFFLSLSVRGNKGLLTSISMSWYVLLDMEALTWGACVVKSSVSDRISVDDKSEPRKIKEGFRESVMAEKEIIDILKIAKWIRRANKVATR